MYRIQTIEGEVSASNVLIDNGVPMREADEIVDSLIVDPLEDVEHSIVCSISCWTNAPEMVLRAALDAAQDADDRVS